MSTFCMTCGKPLAPGTQFCGACGAAIPDANSSSGPAPSGTPKNGPNVVPTASVTAANANTEQGSPTSSKKSRLMFSLLIPGVCVVLVAAWWFFFSRPSSAEMLATINSQLAAANTTVEATAQPPAAVVKQEGAVKWPAMSHTAASITGDISMAPGKLTMVQVDYPLALVKDVSGNNLTEAGKIVDETEPADAHLYRITISKDAHLIDENTLCSDDARWMLAVYSKNRRSLSLAFFSSENEPTIDYSVIRSSTALCGTFSYQQASQ
jgi:hypothetical protein